MKKFCLLASYFSILDIYPRKNNMFIWRCKWGGSQRVVWEYMNIGVHVGHHAQHICIVSLLEVDVWLANHTSDNFQRLIFQKREPVPKTSKIRMAVALAKINRGTLIQGLNSISQSSKSVAKLLQPKLIYRLSELKGISHRLLREVNTPRQPLYNVQVSKHCICKRVKPFLKNLQVPSLKIWKCSVSGSLPYAVLYLNKWNEYWVFFQYNIYSKRELGGLFSTLWFDWPIWDYQFQMVQSQYKSCKLSLVSNLKEIP
jgi:hypothetical protein